MWLAAVLYLSVQRVCRCRRRPPKRKKKMKKTINLHISIPMLYLSAVAVAAKISKTETLKKGHSIRLSC